jgi:gliding motility-associated-like protein
MFFLLFFAASAFCTAQNAAFTMPDTVCAGAPVNITNVQPPSAISYNWSFCSGNASSEPDGSNIGNPGQKLNGPSYITMAKEGQDYYTFITSTGNNRIVKCFFGPSLAQFPISTTDLGSFAVPPGLMRGIQVKNDNGIWYGFVASGPNLIKLVFGSSLANSPTSQVINLGKVSMGSGLAIEKQNADWVGFLLDVSGDRIFRLEFGTNLNNTPLSFDMGNIGQLSGPVNLVLALEKNIWYAFVCNATNSSLTRIVYGSSLLNPAPPAMSLPGITGLTQNSGISLTNDCGGVSGFVTNMVNTSNDCIIHLVFSKGLGGNVTGYRINNGGILNKPFGITEFVRQNDVLYAFIANFGSSSIIRMFLPTCMAAVPPFATGIIPPPFTYNDAGNYNVLLTVDGGAAGISSACKKIVVIPQPAVSLGPDRIVCRGQNTLLDAGTNASRYLWSTGATTRTITADTSGIYWVQAVNSSSCESSDTIQVTLKENSEAKVDTTICQGQTYYVQHALQNTGGIYRDTLQSANGCDSVVKTTLQFKECPLLIWFPNAFTPNGDGLNDFYKPVGKEITRYKLQIYNRWGAMIFESNDISIGWDGFVKGGKAEPDVYTFDAFFETWQSPGETYRESGTFTLSR